MHRHNSDVDFIIGIEMILCTNAHRYNKHERNLTTKLYQCHNNRSEREGCFVYVCTLYTRICVCDVSNALNQIFERTNDKEDARTIKISVHIR